MSNIYFAIAISALADGIFSGFYIRTEIDANSSALEIKTSTNTLSLDITTFQSSKLRTESKPDCICLSRMGVGYNIEGRR